MELLSMFACGLFWPIAIGGWLIGSKRLGFSSRVRWSGLAGILAFMMLPAYWFGTIFRDEALGFAAAEGDAKKVAQLLDLGGDPNRQMEFGSALCQAVSGGHIEVVRLLLDAGADPTQNCGSGDAAHVALSRKDHQMFSLLRTRAGLR